MDSLLEAKLEIIQDMLLVYLFDNDEKLINNWKENKKVKINKKFKPLLQGDWTRKNSNFLNLDELLNTKISSNDFFQLLAKELNRKKTINGDYNNNFNPNLFFLFFKDFYNLKVKDEEIKFEEETNNTIIGIRFCNYENLSKLIRPETLKIIEIHSRFLLNNSILDILHLELFTRYFVENCFIQYEVKLNYRSKRYVDLCYVINEKELILEINEVWHDKINDYFRELSILLSTGSRLINLNLNDPFCTNEKVYENMFLDLCKLLYKTDTKCKALVLNLVECNGFPLEQVELGVGLLNKQIKVKLSEFLSIPFLSDITLEIDEVIKKIFELGNIDSKLDFYNFKKNLTVNNLIKHKSEIYLTPYGIKNFLLSFNGNEWGNRKEYIKFMNDLEFKYYQTIENLLDDTNFDMLKEENYQLKNILVLNNYDQKNFLNNTSNNKLYHPRIPFIIKKNNEFVNYKLLSAILDEEIKNGVKDIDVNKGLVVNYRLLSESEVKNVISLID